MLQYYLMEIIRIIIVTVFFLVLVGISTLSAKVISTSFELGKQGTTIALISGALLPIVFILSMILGRLDNASPITGGVAILSAIAVYLIGSAIIAGLFIGIWSLAKQTPPPLIVTKIILSIGALCGIIGILQTRTLVVREYTVQNSALPESWNGRTAVLISDTHYGTLIKRKSAERVINKIQSLQPDFVLHAGDLFDGPNIDGDKVLAPWKNLTSTTPVFLASGNHDEYGDFSAFMQSAKKAGFTIVHEKPILYEGVLISGIPYINKNNTEQAMTLLDAQLSEYDEAPSLFINHHPAFIEDVASRNVFLMVSGHTHRGQFWPIRYIVRMVYGKYFYGKHEYKDLTTITTSGTGFSGIPQKFLTPPEIVKITFRK